MGHITNQLALICLVAVHGSLFAYNMRVQGGM